MNSFLRILKSVELLILMLSILLIIFIGIFLLKGGPHMVLLTVVVYLSIWGVFKGYSWKDLEQGMVEGVSLCVRPLFILGLIGMLIGVWMMSGTVPTLFSYGIEMISPRYFVVSALSLSIILSTFTGSSLTTVGTVGVALMGIAKALGIPLPIAAGAIVCGAAFGDKVSPLSDTTNLAPGIVGVPLFDHIHHLLWTTLPSISLTYIIFFFVGSSATQFSQGEISLALQSVEENFRLGPLTLISPLLVTILAFRRYPTLPILVIGILSGLLTAGIVQGNWNVTIWYTVLQEGFKLTTESPIVNQVINRGGLNSMLFSISLVMIALTISGLLIKLKILEGVMRLSEKARGQNGPLVLFATLSGIGVNFLTGEQYLSILLPSQIFKPIFEKAKIPLKTLSRTMEDSGTLINPLVPWGVSGVFMANALDVSVIDYAPYAFFLFLSPLFTVLFAFLKIGQGKSYG